MRTRKIFICKAILLLVLIIPLLSGCRPSDIKDDKLYTVEDVTSDEENVVIERALITEGIDPFIKEGRNNETYKSFDKLIEAFTKENNFENDILTISKDGNICFGMLYGNVDQKQSLIDWEKKKIYGKDIREEESRKVVLFIINKKSDKPQLEVLDDNIDFINLLKWNEYGDKVAFLSGGKLLVYDLKQEKLLFNKDSDNHNITYFGWDPDGNKIYTETTNLANYNIYYTDSEKIVSAYEARQKLYYKGILDDNYYFATFREIYAPYIPKEKTTAITDNKGNIISKLYGGRFRDSYKRSMIQVGENGFGLYYYSDIQKKGDKQTLTEEYVYDAKFVADGKMAYIVENKANAEENDFILHIMDSEGKEVNRFKIFSSQIFITSDGKYGITSGHCWEKVDFEKCVVINNGKNKYNAGQEEKALKEVLKTIKGAVDTYFKFQINKEKDFEAVNKYFINSFELGQAAALDMELMFKEVEENKSDLYMPYRLSIYLEEININDSKDRVLATVRVENINPNGEGMTKVIPLEIIKRNGKWYVAGLSTFSDNHMTKDVRKKALEYIDDMKSRKLYDERFKGKNMDILQMQFWSILDINIKYTQGMIEPILTSNPKSAKYCKIYLKLGQTTNEEIYKLILKRNDQGWEPLIMTNKRLGKLY